LAKQKFDGLVPVWLSDGGLATYTQALSGLTYSVDELIGLVLFSALLFAQSLG
jgi:hypothetical protein